MRSARWLPVLLVAVLLPLLAGTAVVVVAEALSGRGSDPDRPASAGTSAPPVVPVAREVLAEWDARRADAWAAGDLRALGELYAPGSAAGRRDVAMLRAWTRRGLMVRDLSTQVLRLDVRRARPERLVLDVTDRVVGGVAAGRGTRLALPTDRASRRVLVLRREEDRWRVVSVRPVGADGPASR
ncbi:hypothetical protein [Nocardioides sp. zg-DK7169]|uniref:hypothetical protein n=1 Tax=Nocardioides sp. zg-DK7169 TaxID=2736600 RepID=UPI0015533BD1|nr:hypothetical protein [Nocardioides sp. zg-DK7169]NPC96751.1 hypothetical protein [Nocardioides sp. zg-DK7169]